MRMKDDKMSNNMPNAETIAAIEEVRAIEEGRIQCKSYTDVDEMMRDILKSEETEEN
jgi:hypothetical protein